MWKLSIEDKSEVYTANETIDLDILTYAGDLKGKTSVSFDMRFNHTRWVEASSGFIIYTDEGISWYIDYRADAGAVRVRRNDAYIIYDSPDPTPAADEWVNYKISWSDSMMRVYINGNLFLETAIPEGDSFGNTEKSKALFNQWGQPMSVKDIIFE